ncbi:hypothetical protein ACWGPC_53965, partial [Streptomyces mirabilis]
MTPSRYSGASGLIDSSALQPARETIGGFGTVDGGAGGRVSAGEELGDAEGLGLAGGVGSSVAGSDGAGDAGSDGVGSAGGSVPSPGVA